MRDEPNGLGLSGALRFDRLERQVERANDKLDALGAEMSNANRESIGTRRREDDLEKRVRALELKFYGILAGILAAVGAILWQGHI